MDFKQIDSLAWQVAFGSPDEKKQAYIQINILAKEAGVYPDSINDFYMARGRGETALNFTVPAINLRGLAYDVAQVIFKLAVAKKVGALIFEIARSEISYTNQPPMEYTAVVLAAAAREGFSGPLFIQGDHFQLKESGQAGIPKEGDLEKMKKLIKEAIDNGFYNIDLDNSTMVNYSFDDVRKQQEPNYRYTAELTEFVRECQPKGITVSIGGEIGHIGGKNSTAEELRAFMDGYQSSLKSGIPGLSKISIQTGTHHGGVPLPDGTLAEVDVDFGSLLALAKVAREYGMGGTVQHGASTLPEQYFAQFPKSEAVEVHLATEFQNIIMDHPAFPKDLTDKMNQWMDQTLIGEKEDGMTAKQFHYKLRKKAWGQFKKECWELPKDIKKPIMEELAKKFSFLFRELKVENSQELIRQFIK